MTEVFLGQLEISLWLSGVLQVSLSSHPQEHFSIFHFVTRAGSSELLPLIVLRADVSGRMELQLLLSEHLNLCTLGALSHLSATGSLGLGVPAAQAHPAPLLPSLHFFLC